jgi:AraC-like DNA-binding protein
MNDTGERCIACRQDSAAARIVAAAEGFMVHDVCVQSALRLLEAVMADPHIAAVLVPGLIMEMIARAAMVQRNACAGSPLVPPLVMEAMSFIEEHLSEPITLRRVSQCLGVGEETLARSFRASTGEYLNAHILRTRTERALHLIATTDQSLKEISAHVGFFDQSHMTNQIKRVTGLTPSQHRSTRTAQSRRSPIDTARA